MNTSSLRPELSEFSDAHRSGEVRGTRVTGLTLLSACAFGVAPVFLPPFAAGAAAFGLALLLSTFIERGTRISLSITDLRSGAAISAVGLAAVINPWGLIGSASRWSGAALPAITLVLAVALVSRPRSLISSPSNAAIPTMLVLVGLGTGVLLIAGAHGRGIDVVWLHVQAAEVLARHGSIYGPQISVPNGAPGLPPGSRILGYPYPPLDAVAYASSTRWLGDPRWVNLISWIAVAIVLVVLARRAGDRRSLWAILLFCGLPAWAAMLQNGWTEMLSAALLGIAALAWSHPLGSGIALGLAFGTKQYFALALPLLMLRRGDRVRGAMAALTAGLTVLPAFFLAPTDAWQSLVLSHANTPPRADSGNVVGALASMGVQWDPPLWLSLVPTLMLFAILARGAPTASRFCRALAAGLALFFLLSSQAMANYWYLVAIITILGAQIETERSIRLLR